MILLRLNKVALTDLLNTKFNGNFTKLAKELELDVAYVYRVLEKDRNCGVKFYSCVMRWCNDNNVDYKRYIFLR